MLLSTELSLILLQAGGNQMGSILMMVAMFAVFFFFFIKPQQKKQKEQKKLMKEMEKGDFVVSLGGIHGKIVAVDENTVTLDVDRGSKLTLEKSSISTELTKKYNDKK